MFEDFLKQIANPLGFSELEPGPSAEQKEELEKRTLLKYQLGQDFIRTFTTPHGRRALQHLREMTIENSTWCASLGMEKGVAHGFAREGQNALVRYIEDTVKSAQAHAEQLKIEAENERRAKNENAGQ